MADGSLENRITTRLPGLFPDRDKGGGGRGEGGGEVKKAAIDRGNRYVPNLKISISQKIHASIIVSLIWNEKYNILTEFWQREGLKIS